MRKFFSRAVVLFVFMIFGAAYAEQNTALSNKQVVKNMFAVFANVQSKPKAFQEFVSHDYKQISDGHKLNYTEFLSHVETLHRMMKSIHFKFIQIVSDGDIVATHHIAHGIKKDGKVIETEFFAFFTLKNGKIVACQEMSRMLKGGQDDKDLSYTKAN